MVAFLLRGSRVPRVQQLILEIKEMENKYDIRLYPVWLNRNSKLIQVADLGSKNHLNTDEWSFSAMDYGMVINKFGVRPNIDVMATDKNTKCKLFYSKLPYPGTLGVDFFVQNLNNTHLYYACPPIDMICKVIDKIQCSPGIEIILIIPKWPSAPYWGMLRTYFGFKSFVKNTLFFHTKFYSDVPSCMFQGRKSFMMAAFHIRT